MNVLLGRRADAKKRWPDAGVPAGKVSPRLLNSGPQSGSVGDDMQPGSVFCVLASMSFCDSSAFRSAMMMLCVGLNASSETVATFGAVHSVGGRLGLSPRQPVLPRWMRNLSSAVSTRMNL